MAVDVKQAIQELISAKFDAKLEALNDKIDLQDIKLDFRSAMKC